MMPMVANWKRYARIWWRCASNTFSLNASYRLNFFSYFFGKIIRLVFFVAFIVALFSRTKMIAGYTQNELMLLLAIMNMVDVLTQMIWLRGFMDLSRLVKKGDFDLVLAKPISTLWWSAFRIFDFFDLMTVPIGIGFLWYALVQVHVAPIDLLQGGILIILSLVLAFSICLLISACTFFAIEIENAWWMYRDLVYASRLPAEVYPKSIQWILTFLVPIFVMVSFPAKALLHRLSPELMVWAFVATGIVLALACFAWKKAIQKYSSASS